MLERIPTTDELTALIGAKKCALFHELRSVIDGLYDMERIWNSGGKKWKYEYKYRRGGKTLCALYAREDCFGLMIIFGRDERAKFEPLRSVLSPKTIREYDEAATYHDGKWVMFYPSDSGAFSDYQKLLAIKRRPNKKSG